MKARDQKPDRTALSKVYVCYICASSLPTSITHQWSSRFHINKNGCQRQLHLPYETHNTFTKLPTSCKILLYPEQSWKEQDAPEQQTERLRFYSIFQPRKLNSVLLTRFVAFVTEKTPAEGAVVHIPEAGDLLTLWLWSLQGILRECTEIVNLVSIYKAAVEFPGF